MGSIQIKLNTIESVKLFCNIVSNVDYDIDVVRGRYVIDAKSILGLYSIDLTKPVEVVTHCYTIEEHKKFVQAIKDSGIEVVSE